MEGFVELILELLFGGLDAVSKAETWIKTTVFIFVNELIAALFCFWSYSAHQRGSISGCVVLGIIAAVLGLGSLIAAIYYHKRDWF